MSASFFSPQKSYTLLPSPRVCLRLKEARKSRGITLDKIAEKTKINKRYIIALEECHFDTLNFSDVYQKNFIKKYAKALGIDPASFLAQHKKESPVNTKNDYSSNKNCKKYYFNNIPNLIKFFLIGGAVFSLILYLGIQIKHTMEPPLLSLSSPEDGYIASANVIAVKGKTEPEVKISINGEGIKNDDNGSFSEVVTLNPGINTIVVSATNKHGKITETTRNVIYKETIQFSLKTSN